MNEKDIYECKEKEVLEIACTGTVTRVVITNGFHSSRVVAIKYKPGILVYEIWSYIDNMQLLTGLAITLGSFCIYIFTGLRFMMLFANLPILIMLFIFYIKRKNFIGISLLKPGKTK